MGVPKSASHQFYFRLQHKRVNGLTLINLEHHLNRSLNMYTNGVSKLTQFIMPFFSCCGFTHHPKRPPFFWAGLANSFMVQLVRSFWQPETFFLQSPVSENPGHVNLICVGGPM